MFFYTTGMVRKTFFRKWNNEHTAQGKVKQSDEQPDSKQSNIWTTEETHDREIPKPPNSQATRRAQGPRPTIKRIEWANVRTIVSWKADRTTDAPKITKVTSCEINSYSNKGPWHRLPRSDARTLIGRKGPRDHVAHIPVWWRHNLERNQVASWWSHTRVSRKEKKDQPGFHANRLMGGRDLISIRWGRCRYGQGSHMTMSSRQGLSRNRVSHKESHTPYASEGRLPVLQTRVFSCTRGKLFRESWDLKC